MLKKLFYASASILMLALAYHFGAATALGQAGSMVTGFTAVPGGLNLTYYYAMTPNGDIYQNNATPLFTSAPAFVGNFWGGSPTPAAQPTWGQLKATYRK